MDSENLPTYFSLVYYPAVGNLNSQKMRLLTGKGKWYGMGLSEHIGFTRWNEDDCQNPILMHVLPANKPRLVVLVDGPDQHSEGSAWYKNKVFINDFLQLDVEKASFTISSISDINADFMKSN